MKPIFRHTWPIFIRKKGVKKISLRMMLFLGYYARKGGNFSSSAAGHAGTKLGGRIVGTP